MSNSYYRLCVNTARGVLLEALTAATVEGSPMVGEMQALLDNFDSAAGDMLDALAVRSAHRA